MKFFPWNDLILPTAVVAAALLLARPLWRIARLLAETRPPDPVKEFRESLRQLVEQERNGIFEREALLGPGETANPLLDRLQGLAKDSPRAAVYEAWGEVEKSAREAIKAIPCDHTTAPGAGPVRLGDTLFIANLLDPPLFQLFNQLRRLRNYALDARDLPAGIPEVLVYLRLATALKREIDLRRATGPLANLEQSPAP